MIERGEIQDDDDTLKKGSMDKRETAQRMTTNG